MARKRTLTAGDAPELLIDGLEGALCPLCSCGLHSGGRNNRPLHRLDGPLLVIFVLRRCSNRACAGWHHFRRSYEVIDRLALRRGDFGLDVILRIGSLRIHERQSVPEIHQSLLQQYPLLKLSERQVARLLGDYNALMQASLQSPESIKEALGGRTDVLVTIDGLQPDKDKEMLWLVRDYDTGLPLASLTHPSVTHVEISALIVSD